MTDPAVSVVPSRASFPKTNPGEQPLRSPGPAFIDVMNAGEHPSPYRLFPAPYSVASSALSQRGLNPNAEPLNFYMNQIYVLGLPVSMSDAQLEAIFRARFGAGVINVKVWHNKHGITIQCGHVTFGSSRLVEEAVALGEWQGIRIERHRPQFPKTLLRVLGVSPEDPNSHLYMAQWKTELRELYIQRQKIRMLAERLHLTLASPYTMF